MGFQKQSSGIANGHPGLASFGHFKPTILGIQQGALFWVWWAWNGGVSRWGGGIQGEWGYRKKGGKEHIVVLALLEERHQAPTKSSGPMGGWGYSLPHLAGSSLRPPTLPNQPRARHAPSTRGVPRAVSPPLAKATRSCSKRVERRGGRRV